MPIRVYVCSIIGTGISDDPYRPTVDDHGGWRQAVDLRADDTAASGQMLVWCDEDVGHAAHADLIADSRITHVPFDDDAGAPLPMTATLAEVGAAKLANIKAFWESHHVPTDGLSLSDRIIDAIRLAVRRWRVRQHLREADMTEALDRLVGDIPVSKRQAMQARLTGRGYDLAGISTDMTVRAALTELIRQNSRVRYMDWVP